MKLPLTSTLLVTKAMNNCLNSSSNDMSLNEGSYKETFRPQIHYSPSYGFMNDPNGLVYTNGVYHLYHQYSNASLTPANVSWGHATSTDLLHWSLHKPAITPDENTQAFSGSAIVDDKNVSGLFSDDVPESNRIVAFYTTTDAQTGIQYQSLAWSTDGGYTFNKYKEPIIDLNNSQFRDPKVFKYEDKFVMLVVLSSQYKVLIYDSKNLINWNHVSTFEMSGILGYEYECPDLFPLNVEDSDEIKYVMIISVNPGSPKGGSSSQYYIGSFDGSTFTPMDNAVRFTSFGKDDYAGVTWNNVPDNKRLWISWASNWEYTTDVPTYPFRSTMTLPHYLSLAEVNLTDQIQSLKLRHTPVDLSSIKLDTLINQTEESNRSSVDFPKESPIDFELQVSKNGESTDKNSKQASKITIESDDGVNSLEIGLQFMNHILYINRGNAGFKTPLFGDVSSTSITIPENNPTVKLRGIVDRSQLELFVNDGIDYASTVFYFDGDRLPSRISYSNDEGVITKSFKVDTLDSVWEC